MCRFAICAGSEIFIFFENRKGFSIFATRFRIRDVAQPGSALRSGRRGRWFESSHPDKRKALRIAEGFLHDSTGSKPMG